MGRLVSWLAGVGLAGWWGGVLWWWVGPGGAGDVDLAVGDGDGPFAVVQVDVVAAAQQRLSHESSGPWVGAVFEVRGSPPPVRRARLAA